MITSNSSEDADNVEVGGKTGGGMTSFAGRGSLGSGSGEMGGFM